MNFDSRLKALETRVTGKYTLYDNMGVIAEARIIQKPERTRPGLAILDGIEKEIELYDCLVIQIVERDGIQVPQLPDKLYLAKSCIRVISELWSNRPKEV
jgi:hypothetical protein